MVWGVESLKPEAPERAGRRGVHLGVSARAYDSKGVLPEVLAAVRLY